MQQSSRENYATLYRDFQRTISASSPAQPQGDLLLEFFDGGIRNVFSKFLGINYHELPGDFDDPRYEKTYRSAAKFIIFLMNKDEKYTEANINDFIRTAVKRTKPIRISSDSGSGSESGTRDSSRGSGGGEDDEESEDRSGDGEVRGGRRSRGSSYEDDEGTSVGDMITGPSFGRGGYGRRSRGGRRGQDGREPEGDEADEVDRLVRSVNQNRPSSPQAQKVYAAFAKAVPALNSDDESYDRRLAATAIKFSNFIAKIEPDARTGLMRSIIKIFRSGQPGGNRSTPRTGGSTSAPATSTTDATASPTA